MKTPFDEMLAADEQRARALPRLRRVAEAPAARKHAIARSEAEMIFRRVGITFAVYGAKDEDGAGTERLIPFDLIPRIIPKQEWATMEAGLRQRVTALNRFIHDVYHGQEILKAGIVPAEQVLNNAQFRGDDGRGRAGRMSTRTSRASTSCAPATSPTARGATTCWKTTCACPAA
jgi:uncharacterized circularly permuted ATP-grasp superfamily protein